MAHIHVSRSRLVYHRIGRVILWLAVFITAIGCIPLYIFFTSLQLLGALWRTIGKEECHGETEDFSDDYAVRLLMAQAVPPEDTRHDLRVHRQVP